MRDRLCLILKIKSFKNFTTIHNCWMLISCKEINTIFEP